VASFVRAYADLANDLQEAGYTEAEISELATETAFYSETRISIKKHSGEELDIKPYEADMRHLINTYIQADPADPLGAVNDHSLVELIIQTGIHDAIAKKLNEKGKLSRNSIAEGIINNVRKTIIRDQLTDPKFYAEMSRLLQDLIKQKREDTEDYEKFLERAEALVKRMGKQEPGDGIPSALQGKPEAIVLFTNLPDILAVDDIVMREESPIEFVERIELALKIDDAMRAQALAGWKGDETKERIVQNFLHKLVRKDKTATLALFDLVKNQPGY
jgi:type I restriction enzyme R subunit